MLEAHLLLDDQRLLQLLLFGTPALRMRHEVLDLAEP